MSSARPERSAPPRRSPAPRLRLVEGEARRRRARVHPAVVTVVMIMAMVAVAVGFKAQQVAGQSHLDLTRSGIVEARGRQQELRARVASVESPARVLEAAEELGMVEPAPVVAVAAPVVAPAATSAEGVAG